MTDLLSFRTEPWAKRLSLALALPALLLGLAACSGTAASDAGTSTTSGGSAASSVSSDDIGSMDGYLYDKPIFEWQLRYAECMRGQGQSFPDPKVDDVEWSSGDPDASAVCYLELGDVPAPIGGAPTAEEMMEEELQYAECLRDHGVSVADPAAGQGVDSPDDLPAEVAKACDTTAENMKKVQEELKELQKKG